MGLRESDDVSNPLQLMVNSGTMLDVCCMQEITQGRIP